MRTVERLGRTDELGWIIAQDRVAGVTSPATFLIPETKFPMAVSTTYEPIRRLRVPTYTILGMALLLQVLDLIATVSPMHAGQVLWRFGAVGLFASAVINPLILLIFIYVLAVALGDKVTIRVIAALAALLAVLILIGAGSFSLDTLQMKSRVQPEALDKFKGAALLALFKLLLELVSSTVLAVSAIRTLRYLQRTAVPRGNSVGSLVVGHGTQGRAASAKAPDVV
jgi:hypothetical protein